MKKLFVAAALFLLTSQAVFPVTFPPGEEWFGSPLPSGFIDFPYEASSVSVQFYFNAPSITQGLGIQIKYRDSVSSAIKTITINLLRPNVISNQEVSIHDSSEGSLFSNTLYTGAYGQRFFKVHFTTYSCYVQLNFGDTITNAINKSYSQLPSDRRPTIDKFLSYSIYADSGVTAASVSTSPSTTYPLNYVPGLEWTNNGRSNLYSLETAYNPGVNDAPLKITTSSPNTQLLHSITSNPIYSSLGDWEYKDTTNSHTWTFDDATGTWQNSTTGYQWSYSNPTALRWHHTASNTYWEYDENTESWTQLIDDGD